ncbi:polysaccharide biosynthesis tyrosine autokinase [Aeoliella mucimassa]|uniref:Tyrosine-protein kinase YwqD n=1 Tax=Aeoliella mucimassa TaxID=2527972 RepID=A0A518AKT8_9BACT|nr:polysaccharide biosynthesis tyrosine autokinase [Aeoliella mucimassa]QDU55353.1 Tyrosine-protein kinase YwqD [Aeoliella mucimassa]
MLKTPESNNLSSMEQSDDISTSDMIHAGLRIWRTLSYRRYYVIASLVVCCVLGFAYYLAAPRYYQSTAKLLINERKADELTSVGDQIANDDLMANQRDLVTSAIVVSNALANLDSEHLIDLERVPRSDWVEDLTDRLSASISRKGSFVEVRYRSLDPDAAAAVVSEVVNSYLSFVDQTHKGSAGDTIEMLDGRLKQVQTDIQDKQRQLIELRDRVGHLALGDEKEAIDPIVQRALSLNESWIEAQQQRVDLEARLAAVNSSIARGDDMRQHLMSLEETLGQQVLISSLGMSSDDLSSIRERERERLEAEREMQSLSPYLGPNNPRMLELKARIDGIDQYLTNYRTAAGQRIAGMTGNELGPMMQELLRQSIAQTLEQEKQKEAAFVAARTEAAKQSSQLVELRTCERDLVRLENLHDSLIDRLDSADIYQSQGPIQAVVVEDPLPELKPVSPRIKTVFLMSVLSGLIVGVSLAYIQDALDDRFNSPEELTAQLGVPVLTLVQRLEPLVGDGLQSLHTHMCPNASDSEAFRTLRTSLSLMTDASERILVSSAEPSDGKTTVSANLAVAFAQAGKRTLVIDADLRRPGMTTLLGLKGQAGVADILTSEEPTASIAPRHVVHTDEPRLDVIPAGLRRPNPAELLSSQEFIELLAWADSQYDQVLVDCPPVLAVSDAQIVGRLVDGAILVVRPDKNHRRLVARACESFRNTGSQVLGVVANDVSDMHGSGYGYGYGYSYHSEDEEEPLPGEASLPHDDDSRRAA